MPRKDLVTVELRNVPMVLKELDRLAVEIKKAPTFEVLEALAKDAAAFQRRWKPILVFLWSRRGGMGAMMRPVLRHWVLLDLDVLRSWLTDTRVRCAEIIDNHDGSYGLAFDLRWLEPEAFIACSETMRIALEQGTQTIEPLLTGPQRVLRPAPSLQDLVARFGRYDLIPPDAWAHFHAETKRWMDDVRHGQAEVIPAVVKKHDAA